MNILEVGAILPLSVKLSDENTTRMVTASVLDQAGEVVYSNINLTHRINGFYLNAGFTMPDTQSVTVIYRVSDGNQLLISAEEVIFRAPEVIAVQSLTAALEDISLSASIADTTLHAILVEEN